MLQRSPTEGERPASAVWGAARWLVVAVLVLLVWLTSERAAAWRASLPRYEVDTSLVRVGSSCPWLSRSDLEAIERSTGLHGETFSFFDPDLAHQLTAAYSRSAWIRRVVSIQKVYPDRVRVAVEIERPAAEVVTHAGRIYVTRKGVRLPGIVRNRDFAVPLIVGARAPAPTPGKRWSTAVAEGSDLAFRLTSRTPGLVAAAGMSRVDVANVGGRVDVKKAEIQIQTTSGAVIEWGRSRLSPLGIEDPPFEHKIASLRLALAAYPGLSGLERVKLQFDDTVVVPGSPDRAAPRTPRP